MWILTLILITASVLLLAAFLFISFRKEGASHNTASIFKLYFNKKSNSARLTRFLQKAYVVFQQIPFLNRYILKIRKRLEVLQTYSEFDIRRETMKISLTALSTIAFISLILIIFNRDITFIFLVLLWAVFLNGIIIDLFVNRVENRLLKNSVKFFEDVRQDYVELKIVEDAIYESTQKAHPDTAKHGKRIYDILVSEDQNKALESYYEVAPNRWYRLFAGIALWIKEYGDREVKNGSLFRSSVDEIIGEINYEIRRRDKLNYLLKGLSVIALAPVLFTSYLRDWATNNFPIMIDFYNSRIGLIVQVLFYATALLSYLLIRKMQENDEARYTVHKKRIQWEKFLYEKTPIHFFVNRLRPQPYKKQHYNLTQLIKQANSPLTIEWLYVQRIIISIICFIIAISLFAWIHTSASSNILFNPMQGQGMYGKVSEKELIKAQETTDFDRSILLKLKNTKEVNKDTIIKMVGEDNDINGDRKILIAAERILNKYNILSKEYFKWWELAFGVILSLLAYHAPVWLLFIQKSMRQMEMKDEVYQLNSVLMILREFERMSVETALEWLAPFAVIFQEPIKNCRINYSSGALAALEQMKVEAPFPEFVQLASKLQNAVERVPLKQAFDDLERAKEHHREVRKEHHNRVIEKKTFYGRIIGMTPMGYLIFMYLVIPMLYLSATEMGRSISKIRNIQ